MFLYITRHTGNVTTLMSILWRQSLLSACLTHSSLILLNDKKSKWFFSILNSPCIIDIPKQLQFLVDQTLRLFGKYLYSKFKATLETTMQVFSCEFCENLRTPTLSNTYERLFLYNARLPSTWRRVCLYAIYCSFIWFKYVESIRTDQMLCVYKFNHSFFTRLS